VLSALTGTLHRLEVFWSPWTSQLLAPWHSFALAASLGNWFWSRQLASRSPSASQMVCRCRPRVTNEFCLEFERVSIECRGGFAGWLTASLLPGLDIPSMVSEFLSGVSPWSRSSCFGSGVVWPVVSEFPSGYSRGLGRVSSGFLFFCPYPWSRSYRRVFPRPRTSCQSDLAMLAPSITETRSLSVTVDNSVPRLLSAFFWSRLALFSELATTLWEAPRAVLSTLSTA
jgi:hypothetical protein